MGFIFGKYALYLKFQDGTKGYLMGVHGDHAMVCDTPGNAEKFMSESGAIDYARRNDLMSCSNSHCSRVVDVYLWSDGKIFRMG